jgi:hypothetical protein
MNYYVTSHQVKGETRAMSAPSCILIAYQMLHIEYLHAIAEGNHFNSGASHLFDFGSDRMSASRMSEELSIFPSLPFQDDAGSRYM